MLRCCPFVPAEAAASVLAVQACRHLNLSEQDSAAHIRRLVGTLMRKPLRRYRLPAPERIDWHSKNLFKHPAR